MDDQNRLEVLSETNHLLAKLVDGDNLSATESEELFSNIFINDTEGYYLAVLLAAIHAKGETSEELLGFCNSTIGLATRLSPQIPIDKTIDLSGTGGGIFKTINVSTTASFVVAACGYNVLKSSYYAVTSPTGSADIFLEFGIDISMLNKQTIESTVESVHICPFYTPFFSPKMKNRGETSRLLFGDQKLRIRTPFHLASNLVPIYPIKHRLYGCYSKKYLLTLAELLLKLGFERALVVFGDPGIPELSNTGTTHVTELDKSEISEYEIEPEDLGVRVSKETDIASGGNTQNIKDFLQILKGQRNGSKTDLVAINAGAALYLLGDVSSIKEGTKKSLEILSSGKPYKVLEELVECLGDNSKLKKRNVN